MENCVEKIYCCDRGDNDNALAAAILANGNRRDDSWPMAAAMMNNSDARMWLSSDNSGYS